MLLIHNNSVKFNLSFKDFCQKQQGFFPNLGQRHINTTKNAIGPKSGQKDCREFSFERS